MQAYDGQPSLRGAAVRQPFLAQGSTEECASPSKSQAAETLNLPARPGIRDRGVHGRLDGLHRGEEEHLLDVCDDQGRIGVRGQRGALSQMEEVTERVRTGGVGEEHDQPVDADAPPAGGRETVLEAIQGVFSKTRS